jgi:hypothetical protein
MNCDYKKSIKSRRKIYFIQAKLKSLILLALAFNLFFFVSLSMYFLMSNKLIIGMKL